MNYKVNTLFKEVADLIDTGKVDLASCPQELADGVRACHLLRSLAGKGLRIELLDPPAEGVVAFWIRDYAGRDMEGLFYGETHFPIGMDEIFHLSETEGRFEARFDGTMQEEEFIAWIREALGASGIQIEEGRVWLS